MSALLVWNMSNYIKSTEQTRHSSMNIYRLYLHLYVICFFSYKDHYRFLFMMAQKSCCIQITFYSRTDRSCLVRFSYSSPSLFENSSLLAPVDHYYLAYICFKKFVCFVGRLFQLDAANPDIHIFSVILGSILVHPSIRIASFENQDLVQ